MWEKSELEKWKNGNGVLGKIWKSWEILEINNGYLNWKTHQNWKVRRKNLRYWKSKEQKNLTIGRKNYSFEI